MGTTTSASLIPSVPLGLPVQPTSPGSVPRALDFAATGIHPPYTRSGRNGGGISLGPNTRLRTDPTTTGTTATTSSGARASRGLSASWGAPASRGVSTAVGVPASAGVSASAGAPAAPCGSSCDSSSGDSTGSPALSRDAVPFQAPPPSSRNPRCSPPLTQIASPSSNLSTSPPSSASSALPASPDLSASPAPVASPSCSASLARSPSRAPPALPSSSISPGPSGSAPASALWTAASYPVSSATSNPPARSAGASIAPHSTTGRRARCPRMRFRRLSITDRDANLTQRRTPAHLPPLLLQASEPITRRPPQLPLRARNHSLLSLLLLGAPASVAQGIEHRSPKAGVACSNHAGGTLSTSENAFDLGIVV